MIRLGPSAQSKAVMLSASSKRVAFVQVPEGYFHEFDTQLGGYMPCCLRIELEEGAPLVLGAEIVCPLEDKREEFAVVAVSLDIDADMPRMRWQVSEILTGFLAGAALGEPIDFAEQALQFGAESAEVAVPAGWRFHVRGDVFEVLSFAPAVPIGCIGVRSSGLPRIVERPTGKVAWPRSSYARSAGAERDAYPSLESGLSTAGRLGRAALRWHDAPRGPGSLPRPAAQLER